MEFDFNLENPLMSNSNDSFPLLLFHIESDHMPSSTYLQTLDAADSTTLSTRRRILSLIHYFSGLQNFDPFSSFLAINYMDRFLSTHSAIPVSQSLFVGQDGKPWILNLVAVSCVTLALKMRNIEFSISDFQVIHLFALSLSLSLCVMSK